VKARVKSHTILRLIDSGEVLGECDLTEARAKAIVKAYALAGLAVEAIAC
jgi:hypothetical protein